MVKLVVRFVSVLMLWWASTTQAILTIEITKGVESGLPIAIVPFKGETAPALLQVITPIVEADLVRSGRFASLPQQSFLSQPSQPMEVAFKDWRLLKAEALVTGSVRVLSPGRVQVDFQLYDVFKEQVLANLRYVVDPSLLRVVAHQISDAIYEKLTGEPGAFNTRIAYISRERATRGYTYKLQVADADGYNPQTVLTSREPMMSPAWSPDGTRLAYVSFEQRRSMIYIQSVGDGSRKKVAESKGINSAPAWSPDGTRLALVLSKDGNPEIYQLNLTDHRLTRLTRHPAIDTEPAWSPDGREIVFTSDRSGKPQIYRMSAGGERTERVTFAGDYNARAAYAPDGKSLVLITRLDGKYRTALLHLQSATLQVLTDSSLDESPSFAPNGRIILYASEVRGRGVLATVSADGRVRQTVKLQEGDIREPAWSPYYYQQSQTRGVMQ